MTYRRIQRNEKNLENLIAFSAREISVKDRIYFCKIFETALADRGEYHHRFNKSKERTKEIYLIFFFEGGKDKVLKL